MSCLTRTAKRGCVCSHTCHVAANCLPLISCVTSAVNLPKRIEETILLIMDEAITLRGKKQRCWSLLNVREEMGEGLAVEAERINFKEKKLHKFKM